MSPVRKRQPQRRPDLESAPIAVTYADQDDPAWDEAIERWLLSLLDSKTTPGDGGHR